MDSHVLQANNPARHLLEEAMTLFDNICECKLAFLGIL